MKGLTLCQGLAEATTVCNISNIYKIQGLAADESAQIAMKIVANCVKRCELR